MPSSVIQAMRYEPRGHTLLIAYRGGRGVYRYFDVSEEEWEAFTHAASKGRYLNGEFKRKGHPYEKLSQPARLRSSAGPERQLYWPDPAKRSEETS